MNRFDWSYSEMPSNVYEEYDPDLQAAIQKYKTEIPVC